MTRPVVPSKEVPPTKPGPLAETHPTGEVDHERHQAVVGYPTLLTPEAAKTVVSQESVVRESCMFAEGSGGETLLAYSVFLVLYRGVLYSVRTTRYSSQPTNSFMVLGRGWGQGPQHAQHLHALFAHIPGLKVVLPTVPYDAKGLLISAIKDNDPVIFLEHRWLHGVTGPVPSEIYREPIGSAKVVREGRDITLVGISYMVLECFRAAEHLEGKGVSAEVIDLRTAKPIDIRLRKAFHH